MNCLIHGYKLNGKAEYIKKWCKIAEDFIENHYLGTKGLEYDKTNPMYTHEFKYKCGGEGRLPGEIIGSWIGLSGAWRVQNWIPSVRDLIDNELVSDVTIANVVTSLMTDNAYLMINNPRRFTPNQFYHVALELAKLGVVFSEFKLAPSCYLVGMQRLEECVDTYILQLIQYLFHSH